VVISSALGAEQLQTAAGGAILGFELDYLAIEL
jgi:hypothetical protein